MTRLSTLCTEKKTAVIPFSFSYIPLKRLALINFEKNPDEYYIALEPQYFEDKDYGCSYRVIAYRRDGYVDVYDDINLKDDKDDTFDVTGKGLCERKKVVIDNARFEKVNGCIYISFQFQDKYGRQITVNINEKNTRKSKGLNLLAPVGSTTEDPSYLPLFFLYDFDFVRKRGTEIDVKIEGKSIPVDNFPIPLPKDFQWRYYTRYSDNCQIIEFANATQGILQKVTPDITGKVMQGSVEYHFAEDKALMKMSLKQSDHPFTVEFSGGLPDVRNFVNHSEFKSTFKISSRDDMGVVSGEYLVKREDNLVKIELIPVDGWKAVPNSLFTKMMFKDKSIFCSWPKMYRYHQTIDINTLETSSYWEREKEDSN